MSETMAQLHERHHGRRPISAKAVMMGDDLLACVLTGVYTEIEKTLIELGRESTVRDTRATFHEATQLRFINEVQRLSGRRVLAFFDHQHVGPDLEVLLYVLGPTSPPSE